MHRIFRATLLLFAGSICFCAAATVTSQTVLTDSIVPVAPAPVPTAPHRPYISRMTLRSSELSDTQNFEVALKMRNPAELQARVAQGEHISPAELAEKYEPLAADYQKVVDWLVQQGFTIERPDPSHLVLFASGEVSQIADKFSLKFARVRQGDDEYTSAITPPIVSTDIASLLVGINGLQPHRRMHVHSRASTSGAGAPFEPSQLAQAYDAPPLYSAGLTGTGQTIAIVIDTAPNTSDLNAFWSEFGVNRTGTVTFIDVVTPPRHHSLPAPSGEETLDTEISSSIAPGANVRVYETYDLSPAHIDSGYMQILNDVKTNTSLNIHEMSMSFGGAEFYETSSSELTTDDNLFSEITALGVSIFASAGDEGATPADDGDAGGSTLTPENPASDPNVTGVGGTSLTVNPNGTASSEGVWNNVTVSSTTGATGGGISYEFSRPSWQTGTGVNTSANRQVPDIAADADEETGAYVILDGQTDEYGGTSLSSPMWAGFTALINQARGSVSKSAIGLLNPSLYPLIGTANFRDITSGNNIFDSSQGYSAGVGFDLCTGCGVPDVANLAETLSGVTSLTPVLVSAVSVQSHAGTNYSIALPLTGTPGVECRGINQTLHLVCTFDRPVTAGAAAVTEGSGSVGTISFSGDTMTVNLNGVSNAQELTVEVSGLNRSSASASVDLGVLLGDINGDGAVNAQDVTIDRNAVESVAGTSGFNPGTDINLDGAVNAQDVTIVRNAVETFIPDF